jgi:hypothetical protein
MAIAIAVIAVVVVLLLIGLVLFQKRRAQKRRELQERYGPEYDRAVQETGSHRAAQRELESRHEQRAQLQIRPLDAGSRQRYTQSWTHVQGRFVDDPQQAVGDADELVTAVMRERGYPTEGFDEQARLLSVDHASTLDNYRQGHHIAGLAKQRQATTEQLRQAMMHYRSLFTELVEAEGPDGGSGGATGGHETNQAATGFSEQPTAAYAQQQGYPQQQQGHPRPGVEQQQGYPQQQGGQPHQPGFEQQQGYPQQGFEQQQGYPQQGGGQQFAAQDQAPQYREEPPTDYGRTGSEDQRGSGPGPMEQPTTQYQRPQFGDQAPGRTEPDSPVRPGEAQQAWDGSSSAPAASPYPTSPPPSSPPPTSPPPSAQPGAQQSVDQAGNPYPPEGADQAPDRGIRRVTERPPHHDPDGRDRPPR